MNKNKGEKKVDNKREFEQGLKVLRWLATENDLLEYGPVAIIVRHALRTRNFDTLHNYLKTHKKLIRTAKSKSFFIKLIEEQFPFYTPKDSDFEEGTIPISPCFSPLLKPALFKITQPDLPGHIIEFGRTQFGKSNLNKVSTASILLNSDSNVWIFTTDPEYRILKAYFNDLIIIRVWRDDIAINFFEPPHPDMPKLQWLMTIVDRLSVENNFYQSSKNRLVDCVLWLFKERGILDDKTTNYPTALDVLNALKALQSKAPGYQRSHFEPLINRFQNFVNIGRLFSSKRDPSIEILQNTNIIFEIGGLGSEVYNTFLSTLFTKVHFYRQFEEMGK